VNPKFEGCLECENFQEDDEICEECESGEHFEPSVQALNFDTDRKDD
jgi:hypothetical protein